MTRGVSRAGLLPAVARMRRERAAGRAFYYPLEAASAGTWTRRGSTALAAPGVTRLNVTQRARPRPQLTDYGHGHGRSSLITSITPYFTVGTNLYTSVLILISSTTVSTRYRPPIPRIQANVSLP